MSTEIIAFNNEINTQLYPIEMKKKTIKTMIMKKSSRTCPICIEGFK